MRSDIDFDINIDIDIDIESFLKMVALHTSGGISVPILVPALIHKTFQRQELYQSVCPLSAGYRLNNLKFNFEFNFQLQVKQIKFSHDMSRI